MLWLAAPAGAVTSNVRLTQFGGTFHHPVHVTAPPGDAHRVFVVEETGKVFVFRDGQQLATPYLDVSDRDLYRVGLTSIAFAPDYAQTGHVYALYDIHAPTPENSEGIRVELDEFTVKAGDPDQVDPDSRRNLLNLDYTDGTDHDADYIEFGPDGLLYMTVGEGLVTPSAAQDTNSPRGKLLRIDPRPNGDSAYTIPLSNPYAEGGGMPEVFAYGLRNPWRFGFDSNGDMVIGDVQEGGPEELNLVDTETGGGTNYGWPCFQGTDPKNVCEPVPTDTVAPIFSYTHTNNRCAVIAGRLVRDPSLPTIAGRFTWGDFCTGELRSLLPTSPTAADDKLINPDDPTVHVPFFTLSSFGEDACGHVYTTEASDTGHVNRIDDQPHPPCVLPSPAPLHYTEDDGAVPVDPALQLSDPDSTTIAGATVKIAGGFAQAEDALSFTDQNGIAGSYDDSTGTLTLSGDAPPGDYETAVRSVRYLNDSQAPSSATRHMEVRVTDSSSTTSPAATRDIEVTPLDDAPVVTTSAGTSTYGGPPVAVDPGLTVTDLDDANLEGARVRIASGRQAGDKLLFSAQSAISGSYDSGTGVLTLTGSAPVAAYESALRSVRFSTTKKVPAPERTVTFRVDDGDLQSAPAAHGLALVVDSDHDGHLDRADNCPSVANPGQLDRDGDGRGAACDPFDPAPGACTNVKRGTPNADTLFGTSAGDRLLGRAGDDVLGGRAGDDCLSGARGSDRLTGGRGDDRLTGGPGADVLTGGRGRDALDGGRGRDHLIGGSGANGYHAGAGDDRVESANGVAEDVHCGRGRDRASVDATDTTHACESVDVPIAR